MNDTVTEMTFTAAIKHYFGFKPGQKLMDFRDELQALDVADRDYFKALLLTVGIKVTG